jgi:hypothetical protein
MEVSKMRGIKYYFLTAIVSLTQILDSQNIVIVLIAFVVMVLIKYIFVMIYIRHPSVLSVKAPGIEITKRNSEKIKENKKTEDARKIIEKEKEYG